VAEELNENAGQARTDFVCTECAKLFIAQLDFGVEGCYIVHCPWCQHEHYRVIKSGKITEERWNHRVRQRQVAKAHIWKVSDAAIQAPLSSAAEFIRDRWLNLEH
jgi:hypothetical protein